MENQQVKIQKIFFAMGTVINITVFDDIYVEAVERAKKRVLELHRLLNAYDRSSETGRINVLAGKGPAAVSPETLFLIKKSLSFSRLTDGLFDITSRPLSQLWKDSIRSKRIPAKKAISDMQNLVDYGDILIDGNNVMLRRPGQQIDLGGLAKGYAADEVKRILQEAGVRDAVANLGGTVLVIGKEQTVGIQDPFGQTGNTFASIRFSERTAVSSGLYEQGFEWNGEVYHHIIDPHTGYPSRSGLAGITLIGDQAMELDALSTALFITGMEKAAPILNNFGINAVFVTRGKKVYHTIGLNNNFSFNSCERNQTSAEKRCPAAAI